jgi:hypothetical protein
MGTILILTNGQSFLLINNKPRTIEAINIRRKTNPTEPNTGVVNFINTKELPQTADNPIM